MVIISSAEIRLENNALNCLRVTLVVGSIVVAHRLPLQSEVELIVHNSSVRSDERATARNVSFPNW